MTPYEWLRAMVLFLGTLTVYSAFLGDWVSCAMTSVGVAIIYTILRNDIDPRG